MKSILVTGAGGFIGTNLVCALSRLNDSTVWAVVRAPESELRLRTAVGQSANVRVVCADLAQTSEVASLLSGLTFDVSYLLAANGDPARSVVEPEFDLKSNVLTLLGAVRHSFSKRVIFLSSGAIYDGLHGPVTPQTPVRPRLPYAVSKLAAERLLEWAVDRGFVDRAISLRFFGAFGPHEPSRKIYSRLVSTALSDPCARFPIKGDGLNLIDAMYVDDAVEALIALGSCVLPAAYSIVDFARREPITLLDLVGAANRSLGVALVAVPSGNVPEYICFASADDSLYRLIPQPAFLPLEDGFRKLRSYLKHKQSP